MTLTKFPLSPRSLRPFSLTHSSLTSTGTASKWGLVAERLLDLAASFSDVLTCVQVFVRRLLELHIFKLVALYTVWVALKEVSVAGLATPMVFFPFLELGSLLAQPWWAAVVVHGAQPWGTGQPTHWLLSACPDRCR
jgi:hypothetical protein